MLNEHYIIKYFITFSKCFRINATKCSSIDKYFHSTLWYAKVKY